MAEKLRKARTGGFNRVDNGLKFTTFRAMPAINQKNYYTEYLKRDSQLLLNRPNKEETVDEDGSKTVVLHPGSRNLRIGLASSAYAKSIPLVIGKKRAQRAEPGPLLADTEPETFTAAYNTVKLDFKERMKFYKCRLVHNAAETCANFNERQTGEKVLDHNDPCDDENIVEGNLVFGKHCLKVDTREYDLFWPIKAGTFNEDDYTSPQSLLGDLNLIIEHALREELKLDIKAMREYSAVLIVPDLYERSYVVELIQLLLKGIGFARIAVIQESLAATFGAGISSACIVDIGAQSTKIACVDEGIVIPDSRVNLKYGGDDVTTAFGRMLLRAQFPCRDLRLTEITDWELLEDLKAKYCTTNDTGIAVQLYSFYQRRPGEQTKKYSFKLYDEAMLPVLGYFYPELFEMSCKLVNKYCLFARSENVYDCQYNDPISDAMLNLAHNTLAVFGTSYRAVAEEREAMEIAEVERLAEEARAEAEAKAEADLQIKSDAGDGDLKESQGTGVPSAEDGERVTPLPESVQAKAAANHVAAQQQVRLQLQAAAEVDPHEAVATPLDHAIVESIAQAVERGGSGGALSMQTFYENIMVVGGGAKFAGFYVLLTDRLNMWNQRRLKQVGEIAVTPVPRDMDPAMVTWKGGAVYGRLKVIDEMWISARNWEILGSRCLQYKSIFAF